MKPSQAFCSARGDLRSLKKEKKAQKQKLGAETRRRDATISRCLLSSSSRLVIMSSHLSLTFEFIFLMFEVLSIFKSTKEKRKLCHALREALTSECPSY